MKTAAKTTFHVIGLMSGTSLDGLDIAFCSFRLKDNGKWIYQINVATCIEYDPIWKENLSQAHMLSGHDLMVLHKAYGKWIAEHVCIFVNNHNIKADFIASHGHTIFHEPGNNLSFQLGDGAALYSETEIPVICDFRSVDVSFGGEGAPLVPIGDEWLFREFDYCLNLGGIANISFQKGKKRIAFDICGCNLLLNHYAHKAGKDYDENGNIASAGTVCDDLLYDLNQWEYYSLMHPKSLDKETMLKEVLPIIDRYNLNPPEVLATLCGHISLKISESANSGNGRMLITGGGAFNSFLIFSIKKKTGLECIIPDAKIINYKEALIFAFLGVLRARNERNSLKSVTGARADNIGGAVYGPTEPFVSVDSALQRKILFVMSLAGFLAFLILLYYISSQLTSSVRHL